jgi:hypothetical protein
MLSIKQRMFVPYQIHYITQHTAMNDVGLNNSYFTARLYLLLLVNVGMLPIPCLEIRHGNEM